MAYWYFDTNAISTLNDLRSELGNDVIHRFLNRNKILITRRNYHEIRVGKKESLRFIDLARDFEIYKFEADFSSEDEIYRINQRNPPNPSIHKLEASNIDFIVKSGVLNDFEKDVKDDLHSKYIQQFEADRKIIKDKVLVVFGIFLGIRNQTQKLGFELDISKINYINYSSTYVSNFVNYFWFMRNPNKEIVVNDFYDLINSSVAPFVERFYSEGALIQALTSIKNCIPSKPARALDRGRQKFPKENIPNTNSLKNTETDTRTPMLQKTELYRISDLRNQIYESIKESESY